MAKDLVTLMIDTYKGVNTEFSKDKSNDIILTELREKAGIPDGKIDYKTFRRHKVDLFEVIEEALTELIQEGLEDQFSQFAEVRNLNWGDTNVFTVKDRDLFKVATISDGNGNLRRQRIDNGEFSVTGETRGVKIYEEMYRLLAGRVEWNEMVDRVARSYNQEIARLVYEAIHGSFSSLGANYKHSGAFALADFTRIVQHVEASTGANVVAYGTKSALAKVDPAVVSDNMKDARNELGFYGVVNGVELREIKQAHKPGTENFMIDDFLLIVPTVDDKMVKIVNEGEAVIQDNPMGQSADMSQEYLFTMKTGVAVVSSAKYGIFDLA